MLSEELVAMAARAAYENYAAKHSLKPDWKNEPEWVKERWLDNARNALTIATPIIQAEAFEEAAKVAWEHFLSTPDDDYQLGQSDTTERITVAIRSLKPSVSTGEG